MQEGGKERRKDKRKQELNCPDQQEMYKQPYVPAGVNLTKLRLKPRRVEL